MKRTLLERIGARQLKTVTLVGIVIGIAVLYYWKTRGVLLNPIYQARRLIELRIPFPIEFLEAIIIATIAILCVLIGGYHYKWAWTGFGAYTRLKTDNQEFRPAKTLWDWMQLLVIPAVLAGGVLLFNYWNVTTQNEIATNTQREVALQTYIDRMSELILERGLRTSLSDTEIRSVARTRTLLVLHQLDGVRKGLLLQFLYESGLISTANPIIDLNGADLSNAHLEEAKLNGVNLRGADLTNAFISEAQLKGSDLSFAELRNADLSLAILTDANLTKADFTLANLYATDLDGADLSGVYLSSAQLDAWNLKNVKSLKGASMPDGSLHK